MRRGLISLGRSRTALRACSGASILLALWTALLPRLVLATQAELVPPTSGIYTGVQFSQLLGDAARSAASCNKGATAPANVNGSAVDGLCWIDDSVSPWIKKRFVNGAWAVEGYLDPSVSGYIAVVGGGAPATISAASTVDLGAVPQANILVSGVATIASFGGTASAGIVKFVRFDSAATIAPSSALTIPGGYPLTTAAGDRAIATSFGSGNWEITTYTRASGVPIDVSAVGIASYNFSSAVNPLTVRAYGQALSRASYPAYVAQMTRVANGTRVSGNATIAFTATDMLGPGMNVESIGVGPGCTIASVVANTSITLNSSGCVTASGTSPVTVFLTGYGSGGSSSTIGAPDCAGRFMAGMDANGANRITNFSTWYVNANGGAQSYQMQVTNLVAHTHSFSGTTANAGAHSHTYNQLTAPGGNGIQTGSGLGVPATVTNTTSTDGIHSHTFSGVTDTGTTLQSGPTPMPTVPPALIGDCRVRVTP